MPYMLVLDRQGGMPHIQTQTEQVVTGFRHLFFFLFKAFRTTVSQNWVGS